MRLTMRSAFTQLFFSAVLAGGISCAAVEVTLQPAPAAPAGASGEVEFESRNAGSASFSVQVEGLSPGPYTLMAVLNPEEPAVTLGMISILDPGLEPDREAGDSRKEDSVTHPSDRLSSRVQGELPPGVVPEQITEVAVTDGGGNALLKARVHPK